MIRTTDRICIVGAGPGGLGAAHHLERAGFRYVTVLEKSDQVGGKARTLHVDGAPVDLGALDVAADYDNVRALAEELGAPLKPAVPLGVVNTRQAAGSSGIGALTASIPVLSLALGVMRYLWQTGVVHRCWLARPGMTRVPPVLAQPFGRWLDSHGMGAIRPMFDYACTNFGYGPLDAIPAAYLLRFVDAGLFIEMLALRLKLTTWPRNFVLGYQDFFQRLAARLRDVRLNVEIEGITRDMAAAEGPIAVRVKGRAEPLHFDQLILACQLDSTLPTLVHDLPPATQALFAQIRTQPYHTVVCRVQGMPALAMGLIPGNADGHVLCINRPPRADGQPSDVCAFYLMNREGLSSAQLHEHIRADMAAVKTMDGQPARWQVGELVHDAGWAYFPHVDSAALAAGFYDQLDAIQGQHNTWFCGGLLGFETVHNTLAVAEDLVERHFAATPAEAA